MLYVNLQVPFIFSVSTSLHVLYNCKNFVKDIKSIHNYVSGCKHPIF